MPIITTIIILFACVIYYARKHYTLKEEYKKQNIKAINIYLDKKLVSKLLDRLLDIKNSTELDIMIDDIIHYFGIEFAALKMKDLKEVLRFKNNYSDHYITDEETKNLFTKIEQIEEKIYQKNLKKVNQKKFIVFKYNSLSMLVVLEKNHYLSKIEFDTLSNEIMIILQLALSNYRTGDIKFN